MRAKDLIEAVAGNQRRKELVDIIKRGLDNIANVKIGEFTNKFTNSEVIMTPRWKQHVEIELLAGLNEIIDKVDAMNKSLRPAQHYANKDDKA